MALYAFDQARRQKGFVNIAGVDEAGVGPWAGPVVVAAVILPEGARFPRLNDSKKLPAELREELFPLIQEKALAWAVAVAEAEVVDRINILQATLQAARQALSLLSISPHMVLYDGLRKIPGLGIPQETVVKGDGKSASIAAASILAKVTRDRLMQEAHGRFPEYGFHEHKGYGTASHQQALKKHGPCPIHRKSYAPIQELSSPFLFETDR